MEETIKNIEQLIADGYISKRKHPTEELWIYNYTPKTQFDHKWTPETQMCRGLIMDQNNKIVARPFPKFFNFGEYKGVIPFSGGMEATEKVDGSLGILYWVGSEPFIATRGSFESDQALKGSQMIQDIYADRGGLVFDPTKTYLFEIIYPENRIVVDYGNREDLILLAIINTADGQEVNYNEMKEWAQEHKLSVVDSIQNPSIEELKQLQVPNKEGFVIKFTNGLRLKIKMSDYVRLHAIITESSTLSIWKALKAGQDLNSILTNVPDEFYQWASTTITTLEKSRMLWLRSVAIAYESIKNINDRKEFAKKALESVNSSALFLMRDGKSLEEMSWDAVRPQYERPFFKLI